MGQPNLQRAHLVKVRRDVGPALPPTSVRKDRPCCAEPTTSHSPKELKRPDKVQSEKRPRQKSREQEGQSYDSLERSPGPSQTCFTGHKTWGPLQGAQGRGALLPLVSLSRITAKGRGRAQ